MNNDELIEMEKRFSEAQQALMDSFKVKMKKIAEEVLGDVYIDVAQHAVDDAHINYRNSFREYFRESFLKEITEKYTYYSYAHSIRMELLKKYPEQISNKIISDLQDRIKFLEEHIEQLRKYR